MNFYNIRLYALLLFSLYSLSSCAQDEIQGRYYMVGSVSEQTNLAAGSYRVEVDFQADQSGNGYLANQIQAGWRVFTSTKKAYAIDTVHSTTLQSAVVSISELNGAGEPTGILMAYQYDGTKQTLPVPPSNATGVSAAMASAILTHNAQVSNDEAVNYGRVRYVNKAQGNDSTAVPGNPLRPYTTWVAAIEAGGLEYGDVIYTYDSEYTYGDEVPMVINPPSGLVFSFSNVRVVSSNLSQHFLFATIADPSSSFDYQGDSTEYRIEITGDLNLLAVGAITIVVDDQNPYMQGGEPIPHIRANIDVQEFSTLGRSNLLVASNGSTDAGVTVIGSVDRVSDTQGAILSTGYFNSRRYRAMPNRKFIFYVGTLELGADNVYPALYDNVEDHVIDSSLIAFNVGQVIDPGFNTNPETDYTSRKGYLSRLLSLRRGSSTTNSDVFISIGSALSKERGSPVASQGAQDYSDVIYASSTFGENPRMVRVSGDLSGSRIQVNCEACVVEDGMVLVDKPTGGASDLIVTGNFHSRQQSAVKFTGVGSGLRIYLDGHFASVAAPAISTAATADSTSQAVRMRGVYSTSSSSYPVITMNRPMVMSDVYLERTSSDGVRPAIESNTAATQLTHGNVHYLGEGSTVGPNISLAALKGIND